MNSYAKYQQWFEEQAEQESEQYTAMSKEELLACFESSSYGHTYRIWYVAIKKDRSGRAYHDLQKSALL